MKKIIFLFAVSLVLFSCKGTSIYPGYEDDESTTTETGTNTDNYFQINGGSKIAINAAVVMGFKSTSADNPNVYQVSFISTDGTNTKTIQLELEFPYGQTLDGTYNITSITRVLSKTSAYSEETATTLNSYSDLTQGTCIITRNGSNINVTFSIKPSNGKIISGKFSGTATIIEV